jgi:uncharacterized membrane protein YhiD involved in acid resistance
MSKSRRSRAEPLQAFDKRDKGKIKPLKMVCLVFGLGLILFGIFMTVLLAQSSNNLKDERTETSQKAQSYAKSTNSSQAATHESSLRSKTSESVKEDTPASSIEHSENEEQIVPSSSLQTASSSSAANDTTDTDNSEITAANQEAERIAQSLAQTASNSGDEVHIIQK